MPDGISIILGIKNEKSEAQAYRFDREKFTVQEAKTWLKKHDINYITFEPAKSILSSIPVVKGKDVITAFVKDGTIAFDDQGNKFIITAEALDADWKTWEGGHITANHKVMENGKIAEVWREKPFVFGRITGLSEELLAMVLSPAYQGTSQESLPIEIKEGKVMRLKGTGTTFAFYPEVPACPLTAGCGEINLASLLPNFSLNTSQLNSHIKSTQGGTKGNMEYTQEQLNEVLAFMEAHSDMITEDMKTVMRRMMSIDKIEEKVSTLKKQVEAKDVEITSLKSQVVEKDKKIAEMGQDIPSKIESAVKTALKDRDDQLAAAKVHDDAVKGLMSVMKKENAEEFLKTNPTVLQIQSTTKALKASGAKAGAGSGVNSTDQESYKETNERFNKRLGKR